MVGETESNLKAPSEILNIWLGGPALPLQCGRF